MSLFRKKITRYVDADGKRVTKSTPGAVKVTERSKVWSGRYRDADDIRREVPLFKDKTASQQQLNNLIREAELGKAGLSNPFQKHAKRPLADHFAEFIADLRNRGRSVAHVNLIETRVQHLIDQSKAKFINDLSASQVQGSLARLKDGGLSQQTANHYLRAIKQFTRWLVRDRRTAVDVLLHLQTGNVNDDRRLKRRELSEGELRLLLEAARTGKPCLGLTGWQRFSLYATALGTGLRASELASLTRRSFGTAGEIATVTIKAADEKSRKGDTLPIPKDLAELLKPWLATLGADEPLWPGKWAEQRRASKFIQADLKTARLNWLETAEDDKQKTELEKTDFLKYRDDEGEQADFHSLRHTFLSRLGRSGVSAKVMQRLARHSTVELTIGRYTHAGLTDLSSAVDKFPSLPPLGGSFLVARLVAHSGEKTGFSVMTGEETSEKKVPPENEENPSEQGVLRGLERRGWDLNPRCPCGHAGFQDRCNRPLCHLSKVAKIPWPHLIIKPQQGPVR